MEGNSMWAELRQDLLLIFCVSGGSQQGCSFSPHLCASFPCSQSFSPSAPLTSRFLWRSSLLSRLVDPLPPLSLSSAVAAL